MKHKGYIVKQNQIMQDIMSTIEMDNNGQNLCTRNYQHIKIRYFFVKDKVDKK